MSALAWTKQNWRRTKARNCTQLFILGQLKHINKKKGNIINITTKCHKLLSEKI